MMFFLFGIAAVVFNVVGGQKPIGRTGEDLGLTDTSEELSSDGYGTPPYVTVIVMNDNDEYIDISEANDTEIWSNISDDDDDDDDDDSDVTDSEESDLSEDQQFSLRLWSGCSKKAASLCKKACKAATKDACKEHKCGKSLKKSLKKNCKSECKDQFRSKS